MNESQGERPKGRESCSSVEGGFTIVLDESEIADFMQAGDFSSGIMLGHFEQVADRIEKSLADGFSKAFLACSLPDDRMARDFGVLQIAHILSMHGKRVLIVDCDFLSPGLSGIVENQEEHGFLDLLLYGSSLKAVAKDIGIDGVGVIGSGSFPVSKTIPFAIKEFEKVNSFLSEKSDVVIYCSIIFTEEREVNPLCSKINQVLLFCQVDRLEEGRLKELIELIKSENISHLELVCYCAKEVEKKVKEEVIQPAGGKMDDGGKSPEGEEVEEPEHEEEPAFLEKTSEVSQEIEVKHSRLPKIVTVVAAVLLVAFVSWWIVMNRSIKEKEATQRMSEIVQKKKESQIVSTQKRLTEEGSEVSRVDTTKISKQSGTPVGKAEEVSGEEPSAKTEKVEEEQARKLSDEEQIKKQGFFYTVHVASFKDISRAGKEVEYLEKNGYEAWVVDVVVKDQTWFRVLVGKFATKEKANQVRLKLKALKSIGYANVIKQSVEK